ncbi:ferrichrome ABC transporter permease [Cryobacterium sp. MLB-32]|uniref:FecCD family ABC transporter permease n=1 Tax=Cryobacterium sp. MLB-32 TaxID=1529318 RepID=UPI0004E647D0|nr:iron chelate uptake ABC transporter family permease subunit [Cryobacterium sp. MLB-32]KFF58386.1 ferrichrome ABC transporter permease [Cryobacterium sp. MLB-32]
MTRTVSQTTTRQVGVSIGLIVALFVVVLLTLTLGHLGVPLTHLFAPVGTETLILSTLRGPRLIVAVLAGAAFGVAGTLFQTVTRNPLGSPDVIGVSAGAAAGAAAFGLLWTGLLPVPVGALVGALVAMALVFAGTGRGFSSPTRVLLVGVGVSAMAGAFVQFVISRAGREQATVLSAYLNGSVASRSWDHVAIIGAGLVILLPCAFALRRRLEVLALGDEISDALGSPSANTRVLAVLAGIGLATAAVSVVGPVAFIALTAPQIAIRLARVPGPAIGLSALTGAVLLALADLLTQQLPLPVQLPVGILTAALGGIYLGLLLITKFRKGTL